MKDSEKNAAGCATWYYRYSVALMYCGRLEEALNYAEKGAQEEPDYPWIWLQVGKLRAHFGDKTGALDAVKQGLKLEPGDYEFLTLQQEIKAGATLEQMEYHWINPDADQTLQQGLDENADDKQRALACIRVDEAGLAEFYELFRPERYGYEKNSPCCEFQYPVKEHLVELSFRMNEAGLSKMGSDWLRQLKDRLDSGEWLTHTPEGEPEGVLTGVFVDQTRRIGLVYQQPGDDQYFQIFLNPDGTKADAIWSSTENSEPEVYSEDEMSAIECSQEQFEKYRHEERHSRYLQEHEGRYLTIPMSDLKDRDQSDEGYEDTDIFVNEEPGTEDMALHNLQLKKLQAALNQLEPSEREFILAYFGMDKPSTIQLGHLFGISQPAALYRKGNHAERGAADYP